MADDTKTGALRAWGRAAVLLVAAVVIVGAAWWAMGDAEEPTLAPEFDEDWVTWITRKQTEDGRAPNADAWRYLEVAAGKWESVESDFWSRGSPDRNAFLFNTVSRPSWPTGAPVDAFAAECLEFARELGVFDDIGSWYEAGAQMPPWEDPESRVSVGSPLRSLCRALLAMAHYDMAANDLTAFERHLANAMELARAAASDRTLHGWLIAVSLDGLTMDELGDFANRGLIPSEVLQRLLGMLNPDRFPAWQEVVEGDRRLSEYAKWEERTFARPSEYRAYAREMRLYWPEYLATVPQTLVALDLPVASVMPKTKNMTAVEGLDQWKYTITLCRSTGLSRVLKRRGTACLLAIELYRAEHGRLPQTLDEAADAAGLSQDMRIDTSAGQQFVYRVEPDAPHGYLLYALGADGVDNGGKFDGLRHPAQALNKRGIGFDYNLLAPRQDIKQNSDN
ncbi:MAG: hypothetical protein KDA20_09650 [Phycisphaerales bacterium]|nr:hypothetical protein [Phycisphaerales bacterium]